MELLVALLGMVFWGIGPAATAESPLPLQLELREIEPALAELPELDSLWRVVWLIDAPEEEVHPAPSVFRWPEFGIVTTGERLTVPSEEKWEPYYTGRLELGYAKIQKMEMEPKFYPAVARLILGVPTGLVEALTTLVAPDGVIANGKQVLDQVSATEDLATIMARSLMQAELRLYGGLQRGQLNKLGVQLGTEEIDSRRFKRLQYRALFTAMKNAYRERYLIPSLDLDTVLSTVTTGDWIDFVIIPAAVSLYAAQFGIDRKIRISEDVRIELQIEKFMRFPKVFTSDHTGRLLGFSVNLFKLPFSAIVSVSASKDGVGFEFIGIGTDINTAVCAIFGHEGSRDLQR